MNLAGPAEKAYQAAMARRISHAELMPFLRAANEEWRATFVPELRRHDEERRLAREAEQRELAEARYALVWCRQNGNPHISAPRSEPE